MTALRTWRVTVVDRGTERRWEVEVEATHPEEAENQARIRVFREHGGRCLEAIEVRELSKRFGRYSREDFHRCPRCGRMKWDGRACRCVTPEEWETMMRESKH